MKFTKTKIMAAVWLTVIVLAGLFLRVYHFDDWMHFQLDQARDAYVIDEALEKGISHLPLLGPRAAGSFLRLGPAFYYIEYLSARIGKIFQQPVPVGMAYGDLVLGVLSIIIFYWFLRRYFNRNMSLALSAVYASSLFLVLYARFSWNPNLLPFFIPLTFYALLKATDADEKKPQYWFYLSVFSLAIATQLHFLAFLALPIVFVVYLLIKRPQFSWKVYLTAAAIPVVIYSPVLINEIKTGGANTQQFFQAINEKSEQQEKHGWLNKTVRSLENQAEYTFLIISGWEGGRMPEIKQSSKGKIRIKCEEDCHQGLMGEILAILIFFSGLILWIRNFWKVKKGPKKDFLLLTGIWWIISLILFTALAYKMAPRFFLLATPLAFISLGFILVFLKKKMGEEKEWIFWMAVGIFIVSNLWFTHQRFQQLKLAKSQDVEVRKDKILKEKTRVTWEQENQIADYMKKYYQKNHFPVFRSGDPHYLRALAYLLDKRKILNQSMELNEIAQQGNYFYIKRTASGNKGLNKYLTKFILISRKEFGTLTVYHLKPQARFITRTKAKIKKKGVPGKSKSSAIRYQWKDIFR